MTRRLRIEWQPGDKVTGLLRMPPKAAGPAVLLAHGAGAGQRHPFMEGLASRIVAGGLAVLTFDYPYMEAGRRAPDRLPKLLACHGAALERLSSYADRIVLAGKSMGGRASTHLAVDHPCAGVIVFGYPLVPLGSDRPRATDHLGEVTAPMRFVQGARDRMGPLDLLRPVVERHGIELSVVADADHGFSVPKRTGLGLSDVLDRLAAETVEFALYRAAGGV
jgi:predicted alpha/beta-hydrolase family hydrolase